MMNKAQNRMLGMSCTGFRVVREPWKPRFCSWMASKLSSNSESFERSILCRLVKQLESVSHDDECAVCLHRNIVCDVYVRSMNIGSVVGSAEKRQVLA
jgi:hypothetical protein